jgi:hypothetical protein
MCIVAICTDSERQLNESLSSQKQIASDLELICHFDRVIEKLVADSRSSLALAVESVRRREGADVDYCKIGRRLWEKRKVQIDRLRRYQMQAQFPCNTYLEGRVPVFMDRNGARCAVAYLMSQSGLCEEVKKIAVENNHLFVRESTNTSLNDWIVHSGLTKEEVALVQPAYRYQSDECDGSQKRHNRKTMTDSSELVSLDKCQEKADEIRGFGLKDELIFWSVAAAWSMGVLSL